MESEQGSTAEPTKEGKSTHTLSLTQGSGEKRQAGAASLQAAKKADGKTKPGPSAERNWDTAAPLGVRFQKPMSYHRHMSRSSVLRSTSVGFCSPRSIN